MCRVLAFKSCTVCFEIWEKASLSLFLCGCCKPLSKSDRISKLLKTKYVFCSELVWPKSFIRKLIMMPFSTNDINCCCLHGKALNGILRTRSFQRTQLSHNAASYTHSCNSITTKALSFTILVFVHNISSWCICTTKVINSLSLTLELTCSKPEGTSVLQLRELHFLQCTVFSIIEETGSEYLRSDNAAVVDESCLCSSQVSCQQALLLIQYVLFSQH